MPLPSNFLPYKGTNVAIDQAIQRGRGAAASVLGQTYSVYRLSNQNGSVITGTPLYTEFPLRLIQAAQKVAIENTAFQLMVFEGIVDNRALVKGDILKETGYENDAAFWIFAQERPTGISVFVRAETTAYISRPYTLSGAVDEQPGSGDPFAKAMADYGGTHIEIEKPLVLASGMYTFSEVDTRGASVQVGIQPMNRIRNGSEPKVPTRQYRTHHLIYVPNTPGEAIEPQDRINASIGDRYEIMETHNTSPSGLTGNICIAERMPT